MEDPLVKLLLDWPKTITYSKREAGYSYYNSLPSGKETHSKENDHFCWKAIRKDDARIQIW